MNEKNKVVEKEKEKSPEIWIVEIKATAVSPLFIGETKVEEKKKRGGGNAIFTRKSGDNKAVVSFFGPIRRYAEAIYRPEGTCDIGTNNKGCGKCLTCDLFGSLGRKGRAIFDYLKSTGNFNQVVKKAVHTSLKTDSGQVNSFIEVEEIQEGTELLGRILIRNPHQKDVEMLLEALKAAEEQGIGGWTKRDMGRAKFNVEVKKIQWVEYKKYGIEQAKKLLGAK